MTNRPRFVRSNIPGVQELQNEDLYTQILELGFNDMIPFVLSNIRKKGPVSWLYIVVNVLALVGMVIYSLQGLYLEWITWWGLITQLILGILTGSLLLIPVHELLHGLAYRLLGAKRIKFGANLQQFFFYVTADRFPVGRYELYFLAMFPFALINSMALIVIFAWMPQFIYFAGFLLFSHNLMCIGDFAIVNYVSKQTGEVFSYDEIEEKKSYFFKRVANKLF